MYLTLRAPISLSTDNNSKFALAVAKKVFHFIFAILITFMAIPGY